MTEIYDINEITEGYFPLSFTLIDRYQREDPCLQATIICAKYQKVSFFGVRNTIEIVTYEDRIVKPQQLQKYALNWYQLYLLHLRMDRTDAIICKKMY